MMLSLNYMLDVTYAMHWQHSWQTESPAVFRWMLASIEVGETIRRPRSLMITRLPGRLYKKTNLADLVTMSCSHNTKSLLLTAANQAWTATVVCMPHGMQHWHEVRK